MTSSVWQKLADREGVAPRTAEWTQKTDTIKWPSEQFAQHLLESMIYVAGRPRIVAPAHSTILRRVALFDGVC